MKYNVGDVVRVKENFALIPSTVNIVGNMVEYAGKEYIIYEAEYDRDEGGAYRFSDRGWWFAEKWLEPVKVLQLDVSEDDILRMM